MSDPTASPPTETLAEKIVLEEFKGLRNEIELRGTEQRSMERNTVLLSASIYGFLLYPKTGITSYADQSYLLLAWYLPPLFNFLALVRWRESVKMIEELARYLMRFEKTLCANGGWETHLHRIRNKRHLPLVSPWYLLFWIAIIIGPLILALTRAPPPIGHSIQITATAFVIGTVIVTAMIHRPRPNTPEMDE